MDPLRHLRELEGVAEPLEIAIEPRGNPIRVGITWREDPAEPGCEQRLVGAGMLLRRIDGEVERRVEEDLERQRAEEERARDEKLALIGSEGKALTDLRPVGVIEIGGRRFDALAETRMIEGGARVRVTAVEYNQIKVREVR